MKTVCSRLHNKACSPKEGGKFTTIWRFSIRPELVNNLTDSGTIADEIQRKFAGGADKVLERIGTVMLEDSLHCAKQGGIVCMTGIGGNQWSFDRVAPMDAIPTGVYLTVWAGGSADFIRTPLNELAREIEADTLHIQADKICALG